MGSFVIAVLGLLCHSLVAQLNSDDNKNLHNNNQNVGCTAA